MRNKTKILKMIKVTNICYIILSPVKIQKAFFHNHRMSTLFPAFSSSIITNRPIPALDALPSTHTLVSQRMQDLGIIASQSHALFTLLPLGQRSIEKLVKIIDKRMRNLGAQKINFPYLTSTSLWKKSGRLETCGPEIMQVEDRHNHKYILSPTYEEAITDLVASQNMQENKLPLYLYQISTKFRDEQRAKHGLLRAREFLMKDLYTFDKSKESSKITYDKISKIYCDLFEGFKLPIKKVQAGVGTIGGSLSHEYHMPTHLGEDTLYECQRCNICINSELSSDIDPVCSECKKPMNIIQGIEIGHTFLLGTRYSSPMLATYNDNKQTKKLLEMGCYGIGLTRLLAVVLENLSKADNFIWPLTIAPFRVCLIPAKKGSKDETISTSWCQHFEYIISKIPGYLDEIIIDDRTKLTIGRRIFDIKQLGIPIIIVVGKSSTASMPQFELIDTYSNNSVELTQSEILQFLKVFSWK